MVTRTTNCPAWCQLHGTTNPLETDHGEHYSTVARVPAYELDGTPTVLRVEQILTEDGTAVVDLHGGDGTVRVEDIDSLTAALGCLHGEEAGH